MSDEASFRHAVVAFFVGAEHERANASLDAYLNTDDFTGRWFERLADTDPNRITANDIVAVSTLSVEIPASTSIRLLGENAEQISVLLEKLPPRLAIWDDAVDLSGDGSLSQLWRAIDGRGMGRTKKSKLLAAKRPHLVPIHDKVVATALGTLKANDWKLWRESLRSSAGRRLRSNLEAVRHEAGLAQDVSVLRLIDIAVWMRCHGWRWVRSRILPYGGHTEIGEAERA